MVYGSMVLPLWNLYQIVLDMDIQQILDRLDELATVSSALEITEDGRTAMFQQASDYANSFIGGLHNGRGFQQKHPDGLEIRDQPTPFHELLQQYQTTVVENGINAASPKHLGYIPGGGIYTSAIADFIVAVTNPFASAYYASPGAAAMENEVVEWLKQTFSFPGEAVGCLTSGGSTSTQIALTAARDKFNIKNERVVSSVVYMSEHVHHSTQKALRIIGLEDVIIRYVPLDDQHRIQPETLAELVKQDLTAGLRPFLIIATAGTTDTGSIDPLQAIADIAEQHNLWFHVDGAYGGFFILTSKKNAFKGIERADSLIIDPHKSLFLPYGVGAVLVKDAAAVLHSHYYTANYMQDGNTAELVQSPANLSPELTKHFRGFRVWLPLQLHGMKPFVACLEEKLLLVQYARTRLLALGFSVGPEPDLSVSYFWYPFSLNADEMNKQLMDEIHADGSVFLSSTIINNRFVIRIAILAFRTKRETIDEATAMIERCLNRVLKND